MRLLPSDEPPIRFTPPASIYANSTCNAYRVVTAVLRGGLDV